MAFSTFFKSILNAYGVEFTEIPLVGPESSIPDVPLDHTIKARLLTDDADLFLALYPASNSFVAAKPPITSITYWLTYSPSMVS